MQEERFLSSFIFQGIRKKISAIFHSDFTIFLKETKNNPIPHLIFT